MNTGVVSMRYAKALLAYAKAQKSRKIGSMKKVKNT